MANNNDFISVEEALSVLAPHKVKRKMRIHTFVGASVAILGADIDLTKAKQQMKAIYKREKESIALAGKNMRGAGHGIAYWTNTFGWVFLATDTAKLNGLLIDKGKANEIVLPVKPRLKNSKK